MSNMYFSKRFPAIEGWCLENAYRIAAFRLDRLAISFGESLYKFCVHSLINLTDKGEET